MFGRMKKAQSPYTDFVTLRNIAESSNPRLRAAIASNRNTQDYVLENLAKDRNKKVRLALLENPNLSLKAWEILSNDSDSSVVEALKAAWPEAPSAKARRA